METVYPARFGGNLMFNPFPIIWSFITSKIPAQVWLVILSVLIAFGAFWYVKHLGYSDCQSDTQAAQDSAKVKALEQQLSDIKQYQAFLLDKQTKNQKTISDLKKGLQNAQDGNVAPVLRDALDGLRRNRENFDN